MILDCVPCLLQQALKASRLVTDDVDKQEQVMMMALRHLEGFKTYKSAPAIARTIHMAIKEILEDEDPYYAIKQKDLVAAKKLQPMIVDFLAAQNTLEQALKIGAIGNNMDAAIYGSFDVEAVVREALEKDFAIFHGKVLEEKLINAKTVLIIGDNVGETIFDKVMIDSFRGPKIYYAVRNRPIINDVTKEFAIKSELDEVAEIISTGCDAPGAILEDCSKKFLEIYNSVDIIISKGQGNYEALSEESGPLFFLLKAKCPKIAEHLDVSVGEYVFKAQGM